MTARFASRSRAPLASALRSLLVTAAVVGLSLSLSGCVVVWGILNADGSGMFELTYSPPPDATTESVAAQFNSPHVHVQSVTFNQEHKAVVRASFDDITQISTAPWLGSIAITRTREGSEEVLRIVLNHAKRQTPEEEKDRDGPRISITLPGRIVEANKQAEITSNRVVWRYTRQEFDSESPRELVVRYAISRWWKRP